MSTAYPIGIWMEIIQNITTRKTYRGSFTKKNLSALRIGKSHTKLRGTCQFCGNCTRCTAVNYIKSLQWNLNDMVSLWKVKGNLTGIWGFSKIRKEGRESKDTYHSSRKSTVCVVHLIPFINIDPVNHFPSFLIFENPQIPVKFPLTFHRDTISFKFHCNDLI